MRMHPSPRTCRGGRSRGRPQPEEMVPDDVPEEPSDCELPDAPDPSELERVEALSTDDDSRWDVFLADDDERDPLPGPSDFWIETP